MVGPLVPFLSENNSRLLEQWRSAMSKKIHLVKMFLFLFFPLLVLLGIDFTTGNIFSFFPGDFSANEGQGSVSFSRVPFRFPILVLKGI